MVARAEDTDIGVAGNARLTGMTAAVLLVALAVEGVTVIDVRQMLVVHLFVGLLLVPITVLKLASTSWKAAKYYRGAAAYRRHGPPHVVLRVLGPFVALSSIVLLGTGVLLLAVGPSHSQPWRDIHQATFVVWFVLTTAHVLGHLVDTFRLARADISPSAGPAVTGAGPRRGLVGASILVGLALGAGSLRWNHAWANRPRDEDGEARHSQVVETRDR